MASAVQPTDAAADYRMTIRYMHGEGAPVIAACLAERMRVSPATVSEMVYRTLGLTAAAKLRVLPGRADPALFHEVPERVRLASVGGE